MMTLFALIAVTAPFQVPERPAQEPATVIAQKMLQKYAEAKSAVGTISLTQRAGNVAIKIDTQVQMERPSKIYLRQVRQSSEPRAWKLVSDGVTFAYDKPEGVLGPPRFKEYVMQNGKAQTIQDMYVAARPGLGDASALLDVLIARPEDMRNFVNTWATVRVHGQVALGNRNCTVLVGDFRETPASAVSGSFEAYIDASYHFVKYVVKQRFAVPNQPSQTVDVASIWDADIRLDVKPNPELYKPVG